jgi:hypothetical protein
MRKALSNALAEAALSKAAAFQGAAAVVAHGRLWHWFGTGYVVAGKYLPNMARR